jgi:hypothetical protein
MDTAVLVETKIDAGRKLVERLDAAGHSPTVASWFLYPEVDQWRLLLGSPEFDKVDPTLAYKIVAEVLATAPRIELDVSDVKFVRANDPLATVLRTMVRTGPAPSISTIRLTSNYINGIFIQDALAYRLS